MSIKHTQVEVKTEMELNTMTCEWKKSLKVEHFLSESEINKRHVLEWVKSPQKVTLWIIMKMAIGNMHATSARK